MSFTFQEPNNPHRYDAIINLPAPKSTIRKSMSLHDRAAQFASFRALSGYEDLVEETARLTDREWELSDEMKDLLDQKCAVITQQLSMGAKPEVTITYFIPDATKNGGRYRVLTGKVKKIDTITRRMNFYADHDHSDGSSIALDRICHIEGESLDLWYE